MRKQRPSVAVLAVTLCLGLGGLRDAAWSQTTKQELGTPVIRMAQMSGTYIGLYLSCGGDARAFRKHYEDRLRSEARDDDERKLALSLFASSIARAEASAGAHMTAARRSEACAKTRATDWHEFAKVIDDGLAGKWRY